MRSLWGNSAQQIITKLLAYLLVMNDSALAKKDASTPAS